MRSIIPLFFCALGALASLRADSLADILQRMNDDAPKFQGLKADLTMDTYQKILDAHTNENGTLRMERSPKREVKAIIEFTGNSARTLVFSGKAVRIYYPAINQYQDVDLGKNAGAVNQYLLLGFGSSGKELAAGYAITDEGAANVSGQPATKLLLIPKDAAVLEHIAKVELWIPNGKSNPIQQQFYDPSGNYRLISYSNMQVNPAGIGNLDWKLPKGAKRQH